MYVCVYIIHPSQLASVNFGQFSKKNLVRKVTFLENVKLYAKNNIL